MTDTAGIRAAAAAGEVEAEGVRRALAAAAAADIVAIVADAAAHPDLAAAAQSELREPPTSPPAGCSHPSVSEQGWAPAAAAAPVCEGQHDRRSGGGGQGLEDAGAGLAEERVRAACQGLFADFSPSALPCSSFAEDEDGVVCGPGAQGVGDSVLDALLPASAVSQPHPPAPPGKACAPGGQGLWVTQRSGASLPAQRVILVANKWDLVAPSLRAASALPNRQTAPGGAESAAGKRTAGLGGVQSLSRQEKASRGEGGGAKDGHACWRVCAVSCRTGEGLDALLCELQAAVAAVVSAGGAADDAALVTRCTPYQVCAWHLIVGCGCHLPCGTATQRTT